MKRHRLAVVALALLAAPASALAEPVDFDWFEYTGRDPVFESKLAAGSYRNPVLAGFHPDPSVTRVGERYFLVNSSFTYFPGIPVFESPDLVHWRQIGNVIESAAQLDFDGLGVSRGIFAPTIQFHAGTYYVLSTAVDSGGNFVATAKEPAGPWSALHWLPTIDGIDPALFFDGDKAYLLNNGPPEGKPLYDGHRAIWIQAFDLARRQPFGPRKVLVNGGVDLSKRPIWIEGPHLYQRDGWYVLTCAEGGTGPNHSQVALRSRSVWGPYTPYEGNPILTQRDLDPARPHPITNAGHAELVEAPDGSWWATFLASRNYDRDHYNTGRETFLLPVTWKDGWPRILEAGRVIPWVVAGPGFLQPGRSQAPMTGNFTWRDEFDAPMLDRAWLRVRVPSQPWADLAARRGSLRIHPLAEGLDTLRNPAFLARRQQHLAFDASVALVAPGQPGTEAGIAAFQNEKFWYFLGVRREAASLRLTLHRRRGAATETVASTAIASDTWLKLRITGDSRDYSFAYDADGNGWKWLRQREDGTLLGTNVAGGFVGAVVGPHARLVRTP